MFYKSMVTILSHMFYKLMTTTTNLYLALKMIRGKFSNGIRVDLMK